MIINSLNNSKVKNWTKLKQKKYRDLTNTFLVEGDHLVNEAIKNNLAMEIISLHEFASDLPTYVVSKEVMQKITSQMSISDICCVCHKKLEEPMQGKILLLDSLQDPGNLGAIIRSAVAFNFATIVLGNNTVDLYNEKVIRSCEGMLFNINIIRQDLTKTITKLKEKNYTIYGTDVIKGIDVNDIQNNSLVALIIGNEGSGISSNIKALCDKLINIRINAKCESLNAAVAASILMYELR